MADYSAFLPMDRRAALAGGFHLADRSTGAALFADISGFTPLTAVLTAELGAHRGAEELTHQLDRVYGALIAQVHAFHGSVIGFSGDAITCWFEGDDGRRATTAALAMQAVIGDLGPADTPGGREISIGIKVAVAAGPARRCLVGDAEARYIEVLAGGILDRTATGEKLATRGEVIVSSEVRETLGDALSIQAERSAPGSQPFFVAGDLANPAELDPWPEHPALPTRLTRRWILPPIYQRLDMGQGYFVSELRQVTAVFLKFGGIDYDGDDDAVPKLDAFVRWVQSILNRYGAAPEHVTLGDKGSYLLLVFGAPVAHEDEAKHALDAALELRNPPAHLAYVTGIQIGINHGSIHAGTYGGSGRLTYGIQGDATNIAARLMGQAAQGQILTAASLITAGGNEFQFRELEPIRLKGLADPMPVAYLESHRAGASGRSGSTPGIAREIVGRDEEKAVVDAALRELVEGEKQILIIEGEAGIGKSSLVAELRSSAERLGIRTFEGAGDAIEQSSPYFAWRRIIRAALGFGTTADPSGVAMNIPLILRLEAIDPELVRLAPLLNAVLPVNLPENELTEAMSGEVRADNLNQLLTAILATPASPAPLVLVLEDAHWLDSASWKLARVVARDVSALLLVLVARPQVASSPDYTFLRRSPLRRLLSLNVLSTQEILEIVVRRLGVDDLPQPVANLILQKAEGHPFFGEELAYVLRDAGHLRVQDGHAEMVTTPAELQALSFPDTIQGIIISRIDRLTARQQLMLKVASVIGRIFTYQTLYDIDPIENSEQDLLTNLGALQKLDITLLETPEPELAYIFRHIITQEVAYGLLTFAQRKRLHQSAAEWYETNQAADLESVYPLLAHHWTVAEVAEKSIPYSLKAGQQALENGAFREAIKHLSDGLDSNESTAVITDPVELAEWHYMLGTAYRQVGQLDLSFSCLSSALDLLGRPLPSGRVRLPGGLLAQIGRQMLHRLSLGAFDGRARLSDHPLEVAKIYEGLQHVFFYQNQTVATVYSILRHLNLAEEAPPSAQRARSYGAMVNVAGVIGLHKQAQGYIRLAVEALKLDVALPDQGLVLQYLAIYYAGCAKWVENEANCQHAIEIAEIIGNRRRWQENVSCLALALLPQGQVERSAQLRQQVYDAAAKENDHQIQVWGLLELAEIALLHGEAAEAASFIAKAQVIGDDLGLTEEIWLHGLLGVTQLRLGDHAAAQTAVDKAQVAVSATPPGVFYLLEPIVGMAEVNMALWQASPKNGELKKRAQRTVKLLKQFARPFPFSKPRSLLWEGIYSWQEGKAAKATKHWLSGLESARELRMPYDEGLILLELGVHPTGETTEAEQALETAREILLSMGAVHDLQRLAALSLQC